MLRWPDTGRVLDRVRTWSPAPAAATAVVALCAVSYSMVAIVGRGLIAAGMNPAAIAFYRFAITALATGSLLTLARPKRAATLWGLGSGMAMGLGWLAYMTVLDDIPVATIGVIYLTYPLFTLLTLWLVFGQCPSPRAVGGGLIIVVAAGVALGLSGHPATASSTGDGTVALPLAYGLAFVTPVVFGASIAVLTERMVILDPFERIASASIGGVVGLIPLIVSLPLAAVVPRDGKGLALVAAIAVGASLLPMTAYAVAAPRVGGAKAAAAGSLELPAMFVLGWLLLAETLTAGQVVAGTLIVVAVVATPVSGGSVEPAESGHSAASERQAAFDTQMAPEGHPGTTPDYSVTSLTP